MKTWIAYLVPKQDLELILDEGIADFVSGDSKEEAEANLWKDYCPEAKEDTLQYHRLFTHEVEESESDEEKTNRLVELAIRFYEQAESPSPGFWAGIFRCLATRDVITLEEMCKQYGVK